MALGGNLPRPFSGKTGSVEETLVLTLRQLESILGGLLVASLYRSVPVSPVPQPDYLNTAVLAHTSLKPGELLALAKALELAAGRLRGERFGPRPLDVDLLLYGSLQSASPELTLPHPRLRERRFVLEPLSEIAPDLPVPPDGATVSDLLARLPTEPAVERIGWSGSI
ncbi:MAG TPA: 2-amino-4-hydroxy-6-hydroxymethyldihydropteridine diphosphokinase [Thermoanaerobaculia bacterium]|nr:2-amino-4-hydroxy-6-hydroxymethyldihydropteridine diphosphokinase [Thermoanaerobaculia bacterium]